MKKLPYIRDSLKFFGKFEVVVDADLVIPCYNLATARSVIVDIKQSKKSLKKIDDENRKSM